MIMKWALVTLTFLCNVIALLAENGEPRAICTNSSIEAEKGDTVTLPCCLDPAESMVDCTFDWTRVDLNKFVYVYRHKHENRRDKMDQYRDRATVNLDNLRRGVLNLQISSVQLVDSGPYRCLVPQLQRTSCVVNLTVDHQSKKKHDANTTRPPADEPNNRDGGKGNLVDIGIGIGIVFIVSIVVLVLVRRGTIQKLMTRLRGRREPNAELGNI